MDIEKITAEITDGPQEWYYDWCEAATTAWLEEARTLDITVERVNIDFHGYQVAAVVLVDGIWYHLVGVDGRLRYVNAQQCSEHDCDYHADLIRAVAP